MFLLFCDKNRSFGANQIAGLRCFHKPTQRETSQLADSFEISCVLTSCSDQDAEHGLL